jgi:hypothetical protein
MTQATSFVLLSYKYKLKKIVMVIVLTFLLFEYIKDGYNLICDCQLYNQSLDVDGINEMPNKLIRYYYINNIIY